MQIVNQRILPIYCTYMYYDYISVMMYTAYTYFIRPSEIRCCTLQ